MEKKNEIYNINIYKLDTDKANNLNFLIDNFKEQMIYNRSEVESAIYKYNEHVDVLYYAYKNENHSSHEIPWYSKWKDFFNINTVLRSKSLTGHGIIVVHLKNINQMYALIFGKAYYLIKSFIIHEYGLYMASRLFDGQSVNSISSKYFSLSKSKSVIQYNENSTLSIEEGQVVDLLISNISVDEKLNTHYIT